MSFLTGTAVRCNETSALKKRIRMAEARLGSLRSRMRELERRYTPPNCIGAVDAERHSGRIDGLDTLRERAEAAEARLHRLSKRIGDSHDRLRTPHFKAIVDSERCIACGICADQCPEAAIVVDKTARVDPLRCAGCGRCIGQCPQGALSLYAPRSDE
jgi:heterodisulfide reductase subunit A-like polyferredoxin